MNTVQKIGYAGLASALAVQQSFAAISFGDNKVQGNIAGSQNTADVAIQNLVANVMLFLAIVAVLYGIYGGFLIVTAGGEEDKVKKGRTIIFQVVIGLVVIFLANSIVQWLLRSIFTSGT